LNPKRPRTCVARTDFHIRKRAPAFLREPSKHIEVSPECQATFLIPAESFELAQKAAPSEGILRPDAISWAFKTRAN
jgi:hypothetical protein